MGHYSYSAKHTTPNVGYYDDNDKYLHNSPEKIVIHQWDDPKKNPTFSGTESWLCNPDVEVSAHYVAEAGKVHRLAPVVEACWHSGKRWDNLHSIGIECNPRCSEDDVKTVARLIANIWVKYESKFPKLKDHVIVGHKDIVATSCPGRWYGKLDELKEMAEELYEEKTKDSDIEWCQVWLPVVRPGDRGLWARVLMAILRYRHWYKGKVDSHSYFDDGATDALKRLQKAKGLTADGVCGAETWPYVIANKCKPKK